MTRAVAGSGVRDPKKRASGAKDPIHEGAYSPMGPVDGRGGVEICGPYEPVIGWPEVAHPGEWKTGSGRCVYAESPDRVIAVYGGEVPVYEHKSVWGVNTFRDLRFTEIDARHHPGHRHCHEVVELDRDGRITNVWDQWLDAFHENDLRAGAKLKSGHVNRLRVDPNDPERHVWLISAGNGGIFKFTNDGRELVLKLDDRQVPDEFVPYVYTQDMSFLPNGELWVGHQHHLMRYSPDGTFLGAVGGQGDAPGEFDGIHGVLVHPVTGDLVVLDRVNCRVQILTADGEYRDEWGGFQGTYTIKLTTDGSFLWAANGFAHKFAKYDMGGRLVPHSTWGTFGIAPGAIWGPHDFDTDSDGNLYVAEDYSGRIQKLRVRENADLDDPQLIGALAR